MSATLILILMMYGWVNVASVFLVSFMVSSKVTPYSYKYILQRVGFVLPTLYIVPLVEYAISWYAKLSKKSKEILFKDIYIDIKKEEV